jgi:hypothetical protein
MYVHVRFCTCVYNLDLLPAGARRSGVWGGVEGC